MPNINRIFNGGLNLDDQAYRVPEGAYIDALNITRDSQGEGQDGVVANILGNVSVSNSLPAGQNKTIGAYADKLRNRVYFFNWNSNGNHGIYYYSVDTDTITKILVSKTDSGGIDILNFNPSYKIYGINIIYRDSSEGDLLFFNDNLNEPRVINVSAVYATWLKEYISVAKAPPQMPAKVTYENDDENNPVVSTILSGTKTIDQDLFTGGIQTDYVSIDSIVSSVFTLQTGDTELLYTGGNATVNFVLSFGFAYNFTPGSATIQVLKNGSPIAGTSQNVSAGFGGFTYNESFSEALVTGDIIRIEATITDAISYPTEFFTCSGGTISAESVVTNPRATINNLRNSLFQFRYRYVFANFEKSVWSTASIVPLPNQNTLLLTEDDLTKNARISVSMSTGGLDVTKIELAARQTKDGITSDWFLIRSFDKDELSISDNDIYTYKFYNDGLYSTVDVLEAALLFDYVPQTARAQELVNGNTLVYGAITEGYDEIATDLSVQVNQDATGFFVDYCGMVFFAQIEGVDSGTQGTEMKVYVYGTGTNTNGEVSTLDNAGGVYVINAIDGNGASVGVSVTNNNASVSVATLLGNISTALQANGWTQSSLVRNILTVTYPTNVTLFSSGVTYLAPVGTPDNTKFAHAFDSGYEYAIQYFDERGRTNGTLTNVEATFNTPSNSGVDFCQPRLVINHRPPTWARYYQILRSNNTTYGKRLSWVSQSAYSDSVANVLGDRYAYIGLSNIEQYNNELTSTQNVVGYTYQQGDRIRFISRYAANGTQTALSFFDYEILGTVNNVTINGVVKQGSYVKIYYPSGDIGANFAFDGTANFQNYEILLYNYSPSTTTQEKPLFEFGKCFGIGNAGTNTAYHIGLNQTQSSDLVTPALIDVVNGDLFYRKRKVPVSQSYNINSPQYRQSGPSAYSTPVISLSSAVSVSGLYSLNSNTNTGAGLGIGDYPLNASPNPTYKNDSASAQLIRVRGRLNSVVENTNGGSIQMFGKVCPAGGGAIQLTNITPLSNSLNTQESYVFEFDKIIPVPAGATFWFVIFVFQTQFVSISDLTIQYVANREIEIIESSFSDVYQLVTNSNGRASVVDENAAQTYFPTLVRFGQSYQADTSINGTNRFYPENFDTYDRGFGDIMRFHVRDRYLKVYQKLKVGNVPVLTQIVKDVTGNPLQANTDQLINKIQYYAGDYGIGDSPCSLAWNNFADYFVDDFRGVVCRLSQDGVTPISILYKTNSFFTNKLKAYRESLNNGIAPAGQTYSGNPNVYGTFDAFTNKYIVALEEINRYSDPNTLSFHQDPYTLAFDEVMNQWESFYSYYPEYLANVNTLLTTFKNGALWRHNSTTYCNFYGTQFSAMVEAVFNNFGASKKTFISLTEFANTVWECPEIITQMNTYGSTPQSSLLVNANFKTLESNYHTNFMRDINSSGGLVNGSQLKGNYMIIKFRKNNANQFYYLNLVSVNFIDSPLNKS